MIISHGRRFIFVHIPKTAGTAMALALEGRAMRDDILIGDTPKAKRRKGRLADLTPQGRLWKHSTLRDIGGVVSPEQLEAYFVFTLVRNPWDRIVSYYHWLQDQSFAHPAVRLAQETGFSEFLNTTHTQDSLMANPYDSYVTDAQGVNRCNLFARLEHLSEDLMPLWDHLGFTLELPRANVSTRRADWRSYYSDADAALVSRIAAQDIAQFGYAFE
ncbi:sulfotransferase family 2 domain-containing protein [Yoonia sp. 208BN28-4]|uniref:sulfotransferase family 2 domain-containing protein n=1 Tax=Yoonia sp. 208BN28-4 TaxID=3126505 RepID=UPI0030B24317